MPNNVITAKPIIIVGDNPATAVNDGGHISFNNDGTVTVTGKIPMAKIREGLAEEGYTLGELVSTHGKDRIFSVTAASASPADNTPAANPVDTATISPAASNPAPQTPPAPPAASAVAQPDPSAPAPAQVGPSPSALFSDSLHGYHNPGAHSLNLDPGQYKISVTNGIASVQVQGLNGNWYNADQTAYQAVQDLVDHYGLTNYPSRQLSVIGN